MYSFNLAEKVCVPKRAYLQLENYDLKEVFLSKTNSILTWKQCARGCSF
jgi:hypothetical protein